MGRRAMRKIDPTLDLSRHLKSLDELIRPLDTTSLFCAAAPLEIEIGTGKGLFLAAASDGHRDRIRGSALPVPDEPSKRPPSRRGRGGRGGA